MSTRHGRRWPSPRNWRSRANSARSIGPSSPLTATHDAFRSLGVAVAGSRRPRHTSGRPASVRISSIRADVTVERVALDGRRAVGVVLTSGEEIPAERVILVGRCHRDTDAVAAIRVRHTGNRARPPGSPVGTADACATRWCSRRSGGARHRDLPPAQRHPAPSDEPPRPRRAPPRLAARDVDDSTQPVRHGPPGSARETTRRLRLAR